MGKMPSWVFALGLAIVGIPLALRLVAPSDPLLPPEPAPQIRGAVEEMGEAPPPPQAPSPPKPRPKGTVKRPLPPMIRRKICVPTGSAKDAAPAAVALFQHATANADGSRVLTVSEQAIICWDVATGRALRIFPRGNRGLTPTFAAPDASTVVAIDYAKKSVIVRSAETGAVVGSYAVKNQIGAHHAGVPGFTSPVSEFVFLELLEQHSFNVHAVSTRTGQGRVVARGLRLRGPKGDILPYHLFPVPGRSILLTHLYWSDEGTPPRSIYALHLANGRSWSVNWVGEPHCGVNFPGDGLSFGPDGRLAFAYAGRVTVGDWATGARSFFYAAYGQYRYKHLPVLTPDGKRLIAMDSWNPNVMIIPIIGGGGIGGEVDELQLFDLTTHRMLAAVDERQFPTAKGICSGLAISGDSRVLVFRRPEQVWIADFERIFGIAPLPAVKSRGDTQRNH
jgi:hypothetical protein